MRVGPRTAEISSRRTRGGRFEFASGSETLHQPMYRSLAECSLKRSRYTCLTPAWFHEAIVWTDSRGGPMVYAHGMTSTHHANFSAIRLQELLVVRWHGRTTGEAAKQAAQVVRDTADAAGGQCVLLLIHHSEDPPPSPGGIRVIFSFIPELLRITRFRVALVLGEGFGAAVVHAVYGRISLRSSTSIFTREIQPAMRRVASAAGVTADELERALREHGMFN